jgi:hypothetical protein
LNLQKQNNKLQRVVQVLIGNTHFELTIEEKQGATETPLDILKRIIERHTIDALSERTCYLSKHGGNKNV